MTENDTRPRRAETMRWLITGASGMVGSEVASQLKKRGSDIIAVGRSELDISDRNAVTYLLELVRPDVVLNCAAYTKVDDCEEHEQEAFAVNALGVQHLAEGANEHNALLVHISTDFVFDGGKEGEWQIDDDPGPLSAYGRTKLAGERAASDAVAHLVVRTSWVFGSQGPSFVEAILKQIEGGTDHLRVVADQRGRPTWTPHLASALIDLGERARTSELARGIFHYADLPACSWFEFAEAIASTWSGLTESDREVTVEPVGTDAFPRPAVRPPNSVLSTSRYEQITGNLPGDWRQGLREYLRTRDLDSDPMY